MGYYYYPDFTDDYIQHVRIKYHVQGHAESEQRKQDLPQDPDYKAQAADHQAVFPGTSILKEVCK